MPCPSRPLRSCYGNGPFVGSGRAVSPDLPYWAQRRDDRSEPVRLVERIAVPSSTRAEFIADGVVHGLGLCFGLVGAAILATAVAADGSVPKITAAAIYAVGLVAMFGCSATYNLMPRSRYRAVLQRLDHCAIFLMIAGTYTPFTALHLHGAWAVGLTAFIWNAALLGIGAKLFIERALEGLSAGVYLALGWVGVVAAGPFLGSLRPLTLLLLAAGGLLYSIGVIFHVWESLPFQKALWHAFVLAGAGLHYAAVLDGIGIA
jgi:hemolysin III